MGKEAVCTARIGGRAAKGKLHLDKDELTFRGDARLVIPFKSVRSVEAKAGHLELRYEGGSAGFELGKEAAAWAQRIRYPRGRLDKLGVKPDARVAVVGLEDGAFLEELRERTQDVASGKPRKECDLVFVYMDERPQLAKLRSLRQAIKPAGAIWVVWPKGRKEFREDDVRAAGPGLGLVDVKVVAFSEALSGLKMVIPVAQRPKKN